MLLLTSFYSKMMKNIFGFLLLIGVCYGSCPIANKCQCLDLPDKTLRQFHAGCNTNIRNCHPDYVAAMHRYCNSIKFPWYKPEARLMAASREHANNVIYFSCVKSAFAGYVAISELKMYFSHCRRTGSQTGACLAAVHRYCEAKYCGVADAGMAQEVPPDSLYVTCFKSSLKKVLPLATLTAKHKSCNSLGVSASDNCFAAASRWCNGQGHSGGITQEAGNGHIVVACYDSLYSAGVSV